MNTMIVLNKINIGRLQHSFSNEWVEMIVESDVTRFFKEKWDA